MIANYANAEFGPWNPGLKSELPRRYLHLSTMFRPDNVTTSLDEACELSDFTGLARHELVEFTPQRLIVHEVLVRVMADLSVPDGDHYEDLGINFRDMSDAILNDYIAPHIEEIVRDHDGVRAEASALIDAELSPLYPVQREPSKAERKGLFEAWWPTRRTTVTTAPRADAEPLAVIARWQAALPNAPSPLHAAVLRALLKVTTALANRHGRLAVEKEVLASIALRMVSNSHGSTLIGHAIAPHFCEAVAQLGLRVLPNQAKPVVMNVKGASAAGKSTLRPLQHELASNLGLDWRDFALISPDIWRKYLLDYDTLGDAFRYAGTLTGHELEVVDRKLDLYMASKGKSGHIPHLLIDRFRFDSFVAGNDEAGGNLLTRFGDRIYLFFMITPPDATVERAWSRGLKVGRYKAVDDLLHHNVEAYCGMPGLFFTWALRTDKRVHYEFLDNSVPLGCKPRTVAFGWNGEMNILDVRYLNDIDRYQKTNVSATTPEEVYADLRTSAPDENVAFLKRCAAEIPVINLIDHATGEIYARFEDAALVWARSDVLAQKRCDAEMEAALRVLGHGEATGPAAAPAGPDPGTAHTLGAWGRAANGRGG